MSSINQLLALLINFIFGFIMFYINVINYKFIKEETLVFKVLISLIFMIDYTIIYLLIFYKCFSGVLHPYYFLTFSLGYFFGYTLKLHVKMTSIVKKYIDFIKKKL